MAFIRLNWVANQNFNLTCAGQRGLYVPSIWPRPKRVKVPILISVHRRPPQKWIIWNYCKFPKRKIWSLCNRNAFCLSLFCVNDNSKVILDVLQIIHCMSMCYMPILCFLLTQKQN
jgi:hypothetical protein